MRLQRAVVPGDDTASAEDDGSLGTRLALEGAQFERAH
jgi:hypothetical protein